MNYKVLISPRAKRQLTNLSEKSFRKVDAAILALAGQSRPQGCKKLQDSQLWRIRVGDYRVVYEIEDQTKTVLVLAIGHRKEIYR